MDLARDTFGSATDLQRQDVAATPAGAALTAQIFDDLLHSPDTSRATLLAALRESRRQFESLLSCASGTFYRCEILRPWRMEFISPGIEAISGYTPEAFVDLPFIELIVPEDLPGVIRGIEEAIGRRGPFSASYRIRHKSGEIRWVSERGATVVYSEGGEPRFLEGFIADVTEAKRLELEAEEARREVERINARMTRIFDHTLESIISLDADWNYRFINKAAARKVGAGECLLGRNLLQTYPDFQDSQAWPALRHAMAEREPVWSECYFPATDEWFELYAVPDSAGIVAFYRDVSDRKQLEKALVDQADDLRGTLDSIPNMVWTVHPDGRGASYNKSWHAFLGNVEGRAGSSERVRTAEWLHPEDAPRCFESWDRSLASGEPFETEMRMRHHSGDYRWLLARCWPQRDDSGAIVKWCGAAVDIHERILAERHLSESENFQSNLLEASTDCIEIAGLDGTLQFVNAAAVEASPVDDARAFVGRQWSEIRPEKSRPAARRAFREALKGKTARLVESNTEIRGRTVWWDIIVSPMRDTDGVISNVLCVARDITEQKAIAERLRTASEQDVLTGLPNRRAFEKRLNRETARARETGGNLGLMMIDLDHFKHVNDTLGHLAGDHLLKVFARRLKSCADEGGFVARLGGDEFAVLVSDLAEEKDLVTAATKVLERMAAPVTFAGKLINGGLSIGCAMFPRDASDAQGLLKHADTALYDLKGIGRGGVQMFNTRMMEAVERTAIQLQHARSAIRDDAVEPYYQPKVRLDTGEIAGFEALLRWWSPGNGIQPPSSVAEAFNDYELSTRIGRQMQGRIFADMSLWLHQGLDLPPISINAAPAEFLRDDYAERLLDRLGEFGIPASLMEVEITEHVFLERRSEQVIRALELLKEAGARIALDDFGTGHSSLSHLRDFPVDVLKIDRSFVSRMLSKPRMLAIVQAITKLGPSLSLDIVAEGVETPEQLHALRDAGCEFGQGYLFGKAMQASEIGRRLTTGNWPFKLNRPLG